MVRYNQRGSGVSMRGAGIGSSLLAFARRIKPYLVRAGKATAKAVGKSALKSGVNLVKDVIVGRKNVGEAFKRRASETGEELVDKLESKVKKMTGGRRRRRRTKRLTPRRKRVSSSSASRKRRFVSNLAGAGKKRRRVTIRRAGLRKRKRRNKKDLFSAYS
jgi:hypothetical protein